MRVGIPYKVVGGTRFYDRREIKDALAYLRAVVNPADEVSVKRVLNTPKRGVGDSTRRPARRLGRRRTGVTFMQALRRADDAGVTGPARQGHRGVPRRHRRRRRASSTTGPAPCSSRCSTAAATWPSCRPSTRSRPRAGSRTWPSWSARRREFELVDEFLEQVSLVADTDDDRPTTSRRCVLMTLHSAKGLEFPVGVPDRHGGRRLPPPAVARRARRAGGGAPPRLRRHHPGPRAAAT